MLDNFVNNCNKKVEDLIRIYIEEIDRVLIYDIEYKNDRIKVIGVIIMGFLVTFFIFTIILFWLLGVLPYDEKIKERVMKIYNAIYNLIFGFYDFLFLCIFSFIYAGSKTSDIIEFIIIYLLLLIPINALFKVRGKINIRKYLIISVASTLIGIATYFLMIFIMEKVGFNILSWF